MDQVFNKMQGGNAAIAPYYAGDFLTMKDINEDLEFVYPEEGTNIFVDSVCVPSNAQNYDAAMKFIAWAAGPEGQAILAKGNKLVPNQTSFGLNEYADSADRIVPNMWAGAYMAQEADIGDYTYFTSLTWITEWSMTFNSNVREGSMTISDFITAKQEVADTGLRGMRLRILGR